MLRRIITISFLLLVAVAGFGQPIYFDNLYLFSDRSDGTGPGGTLMVSDGYVNFNNGFFSGQLATQLSLFFVDFEGGLTSQIEFPIVDTIREQNGNLLVINDTTFVALTYQKITTQITAGDFVLRKMNHLAEIEWKYTYGEVNRQEIPQRVWATNDGGYIMTGQIIIDTGNVEIVDVYTIKTDGEGLVEWENTYGGGTYDSGQDILETLDGGFFILGWTRSFGAGNRDFYLVKINGNGQPEWQQTYGGSGEDVGYSLLPLFNGNYLLTGGGTNTAVTTSQGYLYEVTPSGQQIWHEVYASGAMPADYLYKTIQIPTGELISCGLADNSVTGGNAGWLIKTTSGGELIWQRVFDKNDQTDLFYNVILAPDGGFLLSGQAINEETGSQDAWLLKVDSVGCPYPNCTVGIEEEEKTVMVDVWPNPVSDVLNIEVLDPSASLSITAFDMQGRSIPLSSVSAIGGRGIHMEDVSSWPSGMYILQGADEKGRCFSVKIVKQ